MELCHLQVELAAVMVPIPLRLLMVAMDYAVAETPTMVSSTLWVAMATIGRLRLLAPLALASY